ncbi:endonuclease domain-containing protein [Mycobacterium sp.]|uniref:endonuclease domain-containing protein n=1 Tax=Mycobacterium sp. TaxID=1785 RepID=UPI003F9EA46D
MAEPFIGSEAIAAGALTNSQLSTRHTRLFQDVYVDSHVELTAELRAKAGWLWTGCRGVVAGFAAAALHGSKWVNDAQVVDLIHDNRRSPPGTHSHRDRIDDDEIQLVTGIPVTSPVRTALDFGCWYPIMTAVAAIDALARATEVKAADAELLSRRYAGRRGIAQARRAMDLFDAGAQSPKESWLRVVLIQAGLPRPQTQIPVLDEFGSAIAYLDMGWEDSKVAVEYDGEQHRSDRRQYTWDVRRLEMLERLGWIVIRVVAGDRPAEIISRVRAALARRVRG